MVWKKEYDIFLGWFSVISGLFLTALIQFFYEDYFLISLGVAGFSVLLMISGCSLLIRIYDVEDDNADCSQQR